MELREKIQWISRMALLLFILASAGFLSAITAMRLAIQGREVIMPEVTGKKMDDAQVALQSRGLGMRVEDRVYSAEPVDAVVRQSPPSGMRVKVGQYAHVVLSLGPQQVTIPKLSEHTLREDRIALLRNGLQVGEVSSAYSDAAPADTVMVQDPTAGTNNAATSHVDMLVSLGPHPPEYVMPDLRGLTLGEAEGKIAAAGLKVGKIGFAPMSGSSHGVVFAQTPAHGARVDSATAIDLQAAE